MLWNLKGCPKCGGDLCLGERHIECLQCGYTDDVQMNRRMPYKEITEKELRRALSMQIKSK